MEDRIDVAGCQGRPRVQPPGLDGEPVTSDCLLKNWQDLWAQMYREGGSLPQLRRWPHVVGVRIRAGPRVKPVDPDFSGDLSIRQFFDTKHKLHVGNVVPQFQRADSAWRDAQKASDSILSADLGTLRFAPNPERAPGLPLCESLAHDEAGEPAD